VENRRRTHDPYLAHDTRSHDSAALRSLGGRLQRPPLSLRAEQDLWSGCRGHMPKARQHRPRTLLAQPLPTASALHDRFAPLTANRRDMEEAHSSEACEHIACPPRRNAAKDEHSVDCSATARPCARCKIQSDHWPEVRSAGARTPPRSHPRGASPSATHFRPDVREVVQPSQAPVAGIRNQRQSLRPRADSFRSVRVCHEGSAQFARGNAARELRLAITF